MLQPTRQKNSLNDDKIGIEHALVLLEQYLIDNLESQT